MIAKSDMVILFVSASLLAAGIVRWQMNLTNLSRPSAPIASQQTVLPAPDSPLNAATANQASATTVRSLTTTNPQANPVTGNTLGNTTAENSLSQTNATTAVTGQVGANANQLNATTADTEVNQPLYGAYTVVYGDYLAKIANNFGTTVETLQRINNISGSRIDVDQQLLYPLPAN